MNITPVTSYNNTYGGMHRETVKNKVSFSQKKEQDKRPDNYHFAHSYWQKVKLPGYIPQDTKQMEIDLVNKSRTKRETDWIVFLENSKYDKDFPVMWQVLSTGINSDNRIIPPPVDEKAVSMTFSPAKTSLHPKESSLEYNSNLIKVALNDIFTNPKYAKTLVYDRQGKLIPKTNKNIPDGQEALWVRIPSKKKDSRNYYDNVSNVEKLSNPNWCTRSRDDKAMDVLNDGSFYIFLENNGGIWSSKVAMTMYRGQIYQIQGEKNDNLIPPEYYDIIKTFLIQNNFISETADGEPKNLRCKTEYTAECPGAFTQLLIAKYLKKLSVN